MSRWERYYSEAKPASFETHFRAYQKAFDFLSSQNPNFLDPERKLTFVLGGFHPRVATASSFVHFCTEMHPNPQDRHILLDMNNEPLVSQVAQISPYKIRARLENLPPSFARPT